MNKQSKKLTILFFISSIIFLNACSDRYYEMYKSPCACFSKEDLTRIYNEIQKEESEKINSNAQKNNEQKQNQSIHLKEQTSKLLQTSYCRWPKIGLSEKYPKYGDCAFYKNSFKRVKKA